VNGIGFKAATPLELLHPDGAASRVLALGERFPAALVPDVPNPADPGAEIVLIAPSRSELRRRGWLADAVTRAARALAPQGLVYALLPRGRRRSAARRLRAAGLVLEAPIAQLEERGAPRYLVPIESRPWRYALTRQIDARPRTRRALAALGSSRVGRSLVRAALPAVAIVARRPGAAPAASWMAGLDGEVQSVEHAVVATSWRGPVGPLVVTAFAPGADEPWGVAKLGQGSVGEVKALAELGETAGVAGARVPRLLAAAPVRGRPALVETPVEGSAAAELLRRAPQRLPEVAGAVSAWLESWNRATLTSSPAPDRIERELLKPAEELQEDLPADYRSWLIARTDPLAGGELPVVARHNDLTMWNVRLDGSGALGVLDWADADESGLPLTDLFYALADAAAACDGYRNRVAALRGSLGTIAPLRERLGASLGLSDELVELCFHACWLRHAETERRMGGDGQFLELARWAAERALERPA
jgi:hypothetical protein